MSRFVDLADTSDLTDGSMKRVTVEGRDLLIARVGSQYYASDDHCPHMGGQLSHGRLEGTVVTCPRHGSQFDLTSGRMIRWTRWTGMKLALAKLAKSPRPVKIYRVEMREGRVLVDLD